MKKYYLLILFFVTQLFSGQTPTGNSTEVGVTEGQLSVSLTGSANYNIPIAVPPGINGVVPQVSLSYNSQGGNGMAGYGWNITGISTITRIPSTKFHDNTIDAVDFDGLDRFAFDGQRLVVKSGTSGTYGANNTVYETEGFSNVQITSYGVHPNGANYGPAYFLVEYPDGSKAYYGNSADSISQTDWAITYWENPQGVRISYNYALMNNILSIASIKYGTTGTSTGINQINFVYKSAGRQRPEQAYIGGQSFTNNKILGEIDVLGNGVGFRNYFLSHDVTSLGYERLVTITEKSGDNSKSYNPTVFSYETTTNTTLFNNYPSTQLNLSNVNLNNNSSISGDFDGDGKTDIIIYPKTGMYSFTLFRGLNASVNNSGILNNIGTFNTIFPSTWLTPSNKIAPSQGITTIRTNLVQIGSIGSINLDTYAYNTATANVTLQYSKRIDFPQRTRANGCTSSSSGGSSCVTSYVTENTDANAMKYFSGDFNGDGLTDVIAIDTYLSGNYCNYCYSGNTSGCSQGTCYSNPNYSYTSKAYFIDLNSNLTSTSPYLSGTLLEDLYYNSFNPKIEVLDFNGDGKSDLMVFRAGNVKVYTLDDSNNLVVLADYSDTGIKLDKPLLVGDYNGDGKSDFCIPQAVGSDSWNFYFSNGINSFVLKNGAIGHALESTKCDFYVNFSETYYISTDVNSDGKTDILVCNNRTTFDSQCSANYSGAPIMTQLLLLENKIVNPNQLSFNYAPNSFSFNTNFGIKRYPIIALLDHNNHTNTSEFSLISDNKIVTFKQPKDNRKDTRLKTITTGNGVTETISYQPLDPIAQEGSNFIYTNSINTEIYPNFDIAVTPNFQVVSKIEKQSAAVYKKQLFAYSGAVSNVVGIGFLGFRATMRTNWIDNNPATTIISSVSKNDINLRGANIENYQVLNWATPSSSFAPTTYISKSVLGYNTATNALQANKVFKLQNLSSQTFNGLDNTSSQTTTGYDGYNNPLNATTTVSNGATVEQTTTSTVGYATPTTSPYVIGRPISKAQSVTIAGDATTSNELYTYTNNLLSQLKKYGNGNGAADFITEDNTYDAFGNITIKTITVPAAGSNPAATPRTTNYQYDPSGRFLTQSTDVEGLSTTFAYNTNNGLLNSETNPYGLTTSYFYDSWFKKIKTTDYLGKSNTYAYSRNGNVNTLVTTTGDDGSGSQETYDDLGRKITSSVKDISGNLSSVSYLYDIYDRKIKVFEPNSTTQWNETQYDVYGRENKTISFTGKTVNMIYSGLTTIVNDGSKTKTAVKNALGKVISMTDTPGGTINYTYFANGNLKTSDYGGVVTTLSQDTWGRKTQLVDQSAGTYTYAYNGFGETTLEGTPNGTTNYVLNGVGKLTTKTIVGNPTILTNSSTTYIYDGTTKLITSSTFTNILESNAITTNTYEYDNYKRLNKTTETTPFATFIKQLTFDLFGRTATETTSGTVIANGKTSAKTILNTYLNGYPWQILDNTTQQVVWQTNTVNARGQLLTALLGNGIAITNTYDQYGFVSQFKHDRTLTNPGNVMTLNTVFDPIKGNLSSRTNSMFGTTDSFSYDSLDRLTNYPNVQGVPETQTYDDRGRITQNNLGTYNYTNTSKTYQNTSVTLNTDADTYYKTKPLQNISYNAFKSPVEIIENDANSLPIEKVSFTYNDSNSRNAMFYGGVGLKNARQYQKYYSADGSIEIKQNMSSGGATEFVTYIGGDGYSAPIVLKSDGTTQKYLYLHRDYQGSILAITDASGAVLEKRLFDAWGAIVKVQDGTGNILNGLTILDRGYTGHEHLQSVGLIDMNARLYDPKLHRFLQPDNYVQDPSNTQNYNRYGYCWNTPLKYTDPSGNYALVDDIFAAVVGGVINLGVNLFQGNIHNIGQGFAAFGAGAAAGWMSLYPEFGGWMAGGAIVGSTNAWLAGKDPINGAVMGMITGQIGGSLGNWFSQSLGGVLINGVNVTSPLLNGTIIGSLGGGASGGLISFGMALATGSSFENAINAGLSGAEMGLVTGAVSGAAGSIKSSIDGKYSVWNGKSLNTKNVTPNYDLTPNPNGDNIKMYRGTTGSEGKGGSLFMTDNPEYAASYIKNGGQVIEITIPRSTYMQMIYNGDIQTFQGLHGGSSGFEYQIHPRVVPKFLNSLKK